MANDTQELRLAFVGCGRIAGFHLDGIEQAAARTRVTAAVDPDPNAAAAIAARTGARTYASLDEALATGGFDAVDIMVPHDLHEELATRAFAAGKHVLLEKPMALTLDACTRIQEAARRAGTVFMVAENSQYWPDVVRARELLAEGAIGEAVTARASFEAAHDPFWYPSDSWRYEVSRTGGGVVVDGGAHWIRPLADVAGRGGGGGSDHFPAAAGDARRVTGPRAAALPLRRGGKLSGDYQRRAAVGGAVVAAHGHRRARSSFTAASTAA